MPFAKEGQGNFPEHPKTAFRKMYRSPKTGMPQEKHIMQKKKQLLR